MKKLIITLFMLGSMMFNHSSSAQSYGNTDYTQIFRQEIVGSYSYHEEMVDCPDGVKLLTRIYLPEGDGPWPVVVTRTPYVFSGRGDNIAAGREYAKRGIGYIQQDCRGKGGSEGFFSPNINERADGIALYKWLADQSWCASIGIFGTSYTALAGWIVADSLPEKVKGLYLSHYGVDRFISCFHAGLFREDIMSGWLIDNAEEKINKPARVPGLPVGENYYDFYRYFPHVEADVDILGQKLQYYRDWITHTNYNDPYWNTGVWGDLKRIPPTIDIPVTIVAGQFDHHEEGTLLGYERLKPETQAKSRLIIGSWNHSFQTTPTHTPHEHAAEFNTTSDQFDWFYELLVEGRTPEHEIRMYANEADEWVNLTEWPIKADSELSLHLSTEKNGNAYALVQKAPKKKATITYDYDPQDPAFAVGGETIFTSVQRRGCNLQPEIGYRDDVVSFTTPVLDKDITIAGNVKLVMTVSTDCDDTAFAFTLSEITPDGKSYNVRNAITTLGYRNDPLGDRQVYKAGSVVEIEIEAIPIMWTIHAGNALRLDVKSSLFPEYAIHSNYAGVWAEQAETRIAHQTLHLGGKSEARLILPLIEK